MDRNISEYFFDLLEDSSPDAIANLQGSPEFSGISGTVEFRQTPAGVLVTASVDGLPADGEEGCNFPVYALHIHSGTSCTGTAQSPFADAQGHFDPAGCAHPYHAGDLQPLFSSEGFAWYTFLSARFRVSDVVGRAVIVHRGSDNFTTQPSGNAGAMIACGIIRAL